jgi:membrane protein
MKAFERPLGAVDRFQQRWPVLAVPVAVWSKFNDDEAGNLAALIAYYAFAAIFPLLLVLVTVLDFVLRDNPSLRDRLLNSALSQYPVIGPQIQNHLGSVPGNGAALVIGVVLLLLGARGVAGAMQNALCAVWGIEKEQRPGFPLSLVWSFALVLTVGTGFLVTTALAGLAGGVGNVISGVLGTVVTVLVSLVLNVGMFWLGFRIATARQVRWRDLRTGSAIAAVGWTVLQLAGGLVVRHQLQRASELYGAFGIVLGLVAWLFLQAELTVYAAETDVVLTRRLWPRSIVSAEAEKPGGEGEPVREGRDHGASLEGQPGDDGQAAAGGKPRVPTPRGDPSATDKKAGSAR